MHIRHRHIVVRDGAHGMTDEMHGSNGMNDEMHGSNGMTKDEMHGMTAD